MEDAKRLLEWFSGKDAVVVAFSGGVDSSVIAVAAKKMLGDRAVAVTSNSYTFPESELLAAKRIAKEIGIRHEIIVENELLNPEFVKNPPERCYHCRKGLVTGLKKIAEDCGIDCIVDGANADDTGQHRPGMRATEELGVKSPLVDLGIKKDGVRKIARYFGLSVDGKPSLACLASRIPYGDRITKEKLEKVERAEEFIRGLGFIQVRVRLHGGTARVEVMPGDIKKLLERREEIVTELREIGFSYVVADLEGYRTGSMDEVLR